MKKIGPTLIVFLFVVSICASSSVAGIIYPLEIFTNNGNFSDGVELDLYFVVEIGTSTVDISFYNESNADCSIARIYFDDPLSLIVENIINGPDVSFETPATPRRLPSGQTLDPSFETNFDVGATAPPPRNGINPGEWLTLQFDMSRRVTFADITGALNDGSLRIGAHIIGFPDGSSESVVNTPEPATILLLSLGAAIALRKKSFGRVAHNVKSSRR